MKSIREWIRNPAMIVAILALITAIGGSAYAANKITLKNIARPAKQRILGVGKVVYVSSFVNVAPTGPQGQNVSASCPQGLTAIGGGIRAQNDQFGFVNDMHPIAAPATPLPTTGWGGTVYNNAPFAGTAQVILVCATATRVDPSGAPPLP